MLSIKEKIYRSIEALYQRSLGGTGLLYRYDERDLQSEFGLSLFPYKTKYENINYFRFQFNQNPFNICTFAAAVKAVSEQLCINLSVKFYVALAVKEGRVSGNGFADQRTILGYLIKKQSEDDKNTRVGIVTYEEMPDEVNCTWKIYSEWTTQHQRILETNPPERCFTEYHALRNESSVLEAEDNGFVPITASKMYEEMIRPRGPLYLMKMVGAYLGGHQYRSTGYRYRGRDFATPQTFGSAFGDNGLAWSETLFGFNYYNTYILIRDGGPLLPMEVILPIFLKQHDGLMVKSFDWLGDSSCYVIKDGQKHYVSGTDNMKTFFDLKQKVGLTRIKKEILEAIPEGEPYPLIS